MGLKSKIRNTSQKSYTSRKSGRNTPGSLYSGKTGQGEKNTGVGSELKNLFKQQFSPGKNASVTYRAYEIIPRNSPYSHHFKTLLNAESFISKKEFQMALDIYQRMLNKIPVKSSRDKLEQNIRDIESFLTDYDEPFSPRVQLDINYTGPQQPTPGTPGQQPAQAPGPLGNAPIQIQMTPLPQVYPGTPTFDGGAGAGQMPPLSSGTPGAPMGIPFGFFQALNQAQQEPGQPGREEPRPFGFFDTVPEPAEPPKKGEAPKRASEEIHPQNNIEKLLKELSDGVFQVEKAIFETNKMKVESEEAPEIPPGEGQVKPGLPETKESAKEAKEIKEAQEAQEAKETKEGAPETPLAEFDSQLPPQQPAPGAEKPSVEAGMEAGAEEGQPVSGVTEPTPSAPEAEKAEEKEEEELGEGILQSAGDLGSFDEAEEGYEEEEEEEKEQAKPAIQEIRGVLELKEPEQEDTPFITITYDFSKIPHQYALSKDHNILEYAYYKYKPMLVKAQRFIRKKQITKALNYYRVIRDQQIPETLRNMVDKNIQDISEYLEKYLMSRPG